MKTEIVVCRSSDQKLQSAHYLKCKRAGVPYLIVKTRIIYADLTLDLWPIRDLTDEELILVKDLFSEAAKEGMGERGVYCSWSKSILSIGPIKIAVAEELAEELKNLLEGLQGELP